MQSDWTANFLQCHKSEYTRDTQLSVFSAKVGLRPTSSCDRASIILVCMLCGNLNIRLSLTSQSDLPMHLIAYWGSGADLGSFMRRGAASEHVHEFSPAHLYSDFDLAFSVLLWP